MKIKLIFNTLIIISMLMVTTGCNVSSTGNSLRGFTQRMNQFPEEYNMTQTGYIEDTQNKTLTKFFELDTNKIMLQFEYGSNNELTCLHIVFDNNCKNNSKVMKFAKNCIEAFIENPETTKELVNKIDLQNTITTTDYETKKAKSGDTELLLDTTAVGTVISVNRNMQ